MAKRHHHTRKTPPGDREDRSVVVLPEDAARACARWESRGWEVVHMSHNKNDTPPTVTLHVQRSKQAR